MTNEVNGVVKNGQVWWILLLISFVGNSFFFFFNMARGNWTSFFTVLLISHVVLFAIYSFKYTGAWKLILWLAFIASAIGGLILILAITFGGVESTIMGLIALLSIMALIGSGLIRIANKS